MSITNPSFPMSIEQAPHDLNWATHHLIYPLMLWWWFYYVIILFYFKYYFYIFIYSFLFFFIFSRFCHLPFCSFPPLKKIMLTHAQSWITFLGGSLFWGTRTGHVRVGYMYALNWRFSKIKEPILTIDWQFLKNQRINSHPWSKILKNQRMDSHPWSTIVNKIKEPVPTLIISRVL